MTVALSRESELVDAANACSAEIESLDDAGLLASAAALKSRLRKEGLTDVELAAKAFAMLRVAAQRTIHGPSAGRNKRGMR